MKDIEYLLNSKFQYFFDKEYLVKDKESDKFPKIEDDWNDTVSNNVILRHSMYNIVFPHEATIKNYDEDIIKATEKYKRRIYRFMTIIDNDRIKKIFIRMTNKKENIKDINDILKKYVKNYEIRLIVIDKTIRFSDWKKEEYDWKSVFIS